MYLCPVTVWAYRHVPGCPGIPGCPLWGLLKYPSDCVSLLAECPWVPCGAVYACMLPPLAQGLFVFLLIGLFFHVQSTKPHVFPLISPACLGWSPRHARGLLAGPETRRNRLPTPLARPDQAGRGRVTLPAPALPRPTHTPSVWHQTHGLSQSYLMISLSAPQLLDSHMPLSCLPTCPFLPDIFNHKLLFLSQPNRPEGEAVQNQGFWSSCADQPNRYLKTG